MDDLSRLLVEANSRGKKISGFDLSALNRLLDHKAEDMTCRVEAGMTLAPLQKALATRGQWLPVDPPGADQLTIGSLLATNSSGPRRFGYGTVRDYVIGLTAVLADGRIIHSGGNVVKNVAGYDLMKLFIGSRGSLGVIVEAIFKLRPLPEGETFVEAECASLEVADKLIEAVLESELTPTVLDLHKLAPGAPASLPANFSSNSTPAGMPALPVTLVLGFSGTRDEVDWQLGKAAEIGIRTPSSLDYAKVMNDPAYSFVRVSVLPSKMIETLRRLDSTPFIARAGNGIIYHVGARKQLSDSNPQPGVRTLEQRLKAEFDPKKILPEVPT
jgi:glycolate oxidase FAD binding subunit